jgi:hypothetical protein
MMVWRWTLPLLKYVIPLRVLTRFMWTDSPRYLDVAESSRRLRSIELVWRTGGRLLVSPNCLERSLLLYRVLAGEGINPSLVLGVSREDATVAGHAWVEVQGRTFQDREAHLYQRIATFGSNGIGTETPSF